VTPNTTTDTPALVMPIRSMFDAINARRQVRDMARSLGFGLSEQAGVSLAAWTMADRLGFGATCTGIIVVGPIQQVGREGIRITCRSSNGFQPLDSKDVDSIGWMVDEVELNDCAGANIEVVMIKWKP